MSDAALTCKDEVDDENCDTRNQYYFDQLVQG